jgi:hypothetical protein
MLLAHDTGGAGSIPGPPGRYQPLNEFIRAARRLAENPTARGVVQGQIDRIARTKASTETDTVIAKDDGLERAESEATAVGGAGTVFGSLAGGMTSLKGLNALGRQLQSKGSWLEGIQQLTSQLSPDQLRTAAQEAVASLPDSVRSNLAGRLTSQVDRLPTGAAGDLPGLVSGYLREKGGAQQLMSLLMVARAGPAGAAMSLIAAMKDPTVREFAKSLMGALVRAKGRGTPT